MVDLESVSPTRLVFVFLRPLSRLGRGRFPGRDILDNHLDYPHVLELAERVFDARNPMNPQGNQNPKIRILKSLIAQNLKTSSKTHETSSNALKAFKYTCSC